jgi:succinate dehydrogenase flavin-adding protein (antitoxin of CptAB toxin-antitoxin module)
MNRFDYEIYRKYSNDIIEYLSFILKLPIEISILYNDDQKVKKIYFRSKLDGLKETDAFSVTFINNRFESYSSFLISENDIIGLLTKLIRDEKLNKLI